MNKLLMGFGAVIVLMVSLVLSYTFGKTRADMELLPGFWEANSEFNREAGLQLFSFYIGDKNDGVYPAYLLMVEDGDDQNMLINEPTQFIINEPFTNFIATDDCREMLLKFDKLETDLIPYMLKMRYYPRTTKMVLYDHSKIYAVLFKNSVLSELERIKKEKDNEPIVKLVADEPFDVIDDEVIENV